MNIIPFPKRVISKNKHFLLNKSKGISCAYNNIIDNFNEFLLNTNHFSLAKGNDIVLEIDNNLDCNDEGYCLKIDEKSITIKAKKPNGLFYGVQTLKQIIFEHRIESKQRIEVPCCEVFDEPDFSYRGFMLDCARHYFDKQVVKKYLDIMSLQKQNIFHWHLTEDQGFRLEIDSYPLLAEIGSKRTQTKQNGIPHGGYYSKADVKEIVKYAQDRYINIIPEFDMPGHTRSVLASYPDLGCSKKKLEVSTHWGIHSDILCAGKEEVYTFLKKTLTEIADMFPYEYIHLGGDEAVKVEWTKCPDCKKKMEELGISSYEDLQGYMTNFAIEHLKTLGKKVVCWNESIYSHSLDESAMVQFWQLDGTKHTLEELKKGRKAIYSPTSSYYLDYPYSMTSLKKAYLKSGLTKEFEPYKEGIVGLEPPMWTEHVPSCERLQYQVFPRLTAFAEVCWGKKDKDYIEFENRLNVYNVYLKKMYDITPAQKSEYAPNIFTKLRQTIAFGRSWYDPETIKQAKIAHKAMKEAVEDKE